MESKEKILLEFLEWAKNEVDDVFEIFDSPEAVVQNYISETEE